MKWFATATRDDDARKAAEVPAGSRIYAVGDIHGCLDLLRELHEVITDDAVRHAGKRLMLVYLGDYVDRGGQSFEVIDALVHEPLPGFEIVHLKGNHEDLMLRFIEHGEYGETWLFNGGGATLTSYGLDGFGHFGAGADLPTLRRELENALPASHWAFLGGLSLTHREGDYLFVHAGLRPGVPLDQQTEKDLVWIREPFLGADEDFGCVVVHGHTPSFAPVVRPNRVCIDTHAYASGTLTCLVLEGAKRTFLHT